MIIMERTLEQVFFCPSLKMNSVQGWDDALQHMHLGEFLEILAKEMTALYFVTSP